MPEQMIEASIAFLTAKDDLYVVGLKERDGERYLGISIGPCEAQHISILVKDKPFQRPLTFDLMQNLIKLGNLQVKQVTINDFCDGFYHANLAISKQDAPDTTSIQVDCRPSDALALATKLGVPILVSSDIMGRYGKTVDSTAATHKRKKGGFWSIFKKAP